MSSPVSSSTFSDEVDLQAEGAAISNSASFDMDSLESEAELLLAQRRSEPLRDINLSPVYPNSDNAEEDEGGEEETLSIGSFSNVHSPSNEVFIPSTSIMISHHHYNLRSLTHSQSENRPPSLTRIPIIQRTTPRSSLSSSSGVEKPPLLLPTNTHLQVRIRRLKVTGEWKWTEGKGDTCGICRAPFEGCCVDCKMPGDECPLVLGQCKHPFHMHCIVKWTNSQATQTKPACPLCRQEWKFVS